MMPYFDAVFDVLECNYSAAELGLVRDGFSWREDVLQYLYDSQS